MNNLVELDYDFMQDFYLCTSVLKVLHKLFSKM